MDGLQSSVSGSGTTTTLQYPSSQSDDEEITVSTVLYLQSSVDVPAFYLEGFSIVELRSYFLNILTYYLETILTQNVIWKRKKS